MGYSMLTLTQYGRRVTAIVCMAVLIFAIGSSGVHAGILNSLFSVGQAGVGKKTFLDRTTDAFGEIMKKTIAGEDNDALRLANDTVNNAQGQLLVDSSFTLSAINNLAKRASNAKQKLKSFVGDLKQGARIVATRALAVNTVKHDNGWSEQSSLRLSEPIKKVDSALVDQTSRISSAGGKYHQTAGRPDKTDSEIKEDTNQVTQVPSELEQAVMDSTGWGGWDESDPRYFGVDREAALVEAYAARCWDMYGITKGMSMFETMKLRMKNDECPGPEGANKMTSNSLEGGGEDYLTVLNDMDEKERLAEEKRRYAEEQKLEQERRYAEEQKLEQERVREEQKRLELAEVERERQREEVAQSQASDFNCKVPDQNLLNAIQETQQRGEGGGAATAYCAAANLHWIVVWQAQRCLSDSSLSSIELEQTQLQLESARSTGRSNAEGYATLTDGQVCKCWTPYCLK